MARLRAWRLPNSRPFRGGDRAVLLFRRSARVAAVDRWVIGPNRSGCDGDSNVVWVEAVGYTCRFTARQHDLHAAT